MYYFHFEVTNFFIKYKIKLVIYKPEPAKSI